MKVFALSFLSFLILFAPTQVKANQSLRFHVTDSAKEKRIVKILNKLKNTPSKTYSIATVDLNGDSLDEYVLRPQNIELCDQEKFCSYVIMALQDYEPIIIGELEAHKVLISNNKTYGIRHIILYNDLYNDYKSAIAVWDPFSFRFKAP